MCLARGPDQYHGETHVTRLLQKLDLRDRVQAIVLAYQTGLFDQS